MHSGPKVNVKGFNHCQPRFGQRKKHVMIRSTDHGISEHQLKVTRAVLAWNVDKELPLDVFFSFLSVPLL